MAYFKYLDFKTYLGTKNSRLKYTRGICNVNSIMLDLKEYS